MHCYISNEYRDQEETYCILALCQWHEIGQAEEYTYEQKRAPLVELLELLYKRVIKWFTVYQIAKLDDCELKLNRQLSPYCFEVVPCKNRESYPSHYKEEGIENS